MRDGAEQIERLLRQPAVVDDHSRSARRSSLDDAAHAVDDQIRRAASHLTRSPVSRKITVTLGVPRIRRRTRHSPVASPGSTSASSPRRAT